MQNIYLYHLLPIQHPQQYTRHKSISSRTDTTHRTIYKTYIHITLYLLSTQTIYKTYIYITPYRLNTTTVYKTYIYITFYRFNTPNNTQNIHLYHLVPFKHPQQYKKHTSISPFTDSTLPTIQKTYIYISPRTI